MDIGWFRDLAIIVLVVVDTVVLILITVLVFSLYRRMRSILDSAKTVANTIQGIRQGIDSVSKLFRRKGG